MNYALYESLRLLSGEGLIQVYYRHRRMGEALQKGLEAMGLEMQVAKGFRLPQLTAIRIPEGVQDDVVRSRLLREFGIEIGSGLGPLKAKIWRVGLMGQSCRRKNVIVFLSALAYILRSEGSFIPRDDGIQAAMEHLHETEKGAITE